MTWRPAGWTAALAVLGAGLALLLLLFHAEAAAAVRVWRESTAFGHCILVAPIAAFLAWERRGRLAGLPPAPMPALALLAVPLGAAWFVADRLGVMEGRQFCALFVLWLLVLSVLGWQVGRAMAVPLGYTLFLVPFGAFLVPGLQDFTARFIDVGLSLLSIPHVVTATFIEIPEGNFRVAEACAGLRFLIAAIAFGALYACVIYRGLWRRAGFIAVCVVVPVLANGVRALGIVLLGHARGSAEAGAVDHVLYGWIFFSAVILLLVLLGLPFRQDVAGPARPAAVPPSAPGAMAGSSVVLAAACVVGLAALSPAAASWLDHAARVRTAALAGTRDGLATALAVPPGCTASPPVGGRRRIACGGIALTSDIAVFARRDGTGALAAWRAALATGDAEDADTSWRDLASGRWCIVTTHDPDRMVAAALWLDGAPAPDGVALRLRLARAGLSDGGPDPSPMVLATIAVPAADAASQAALERLAGARWLP